MESQDISSTLKRLIGHLKIETAEDRKKFNQLKRSLSKSVIEEKLCKPPKPGFSFEKSDLFSDDMISDVQKKSISSIVNNRLKAKEETRYKVFRREIPVREQLLHNSVAEWAIGSKADHVLGPLKNQDGRQFWYDFYRLEKLVTLYMQGAVHPVLLFKIRQSGALINNPNFPVTAKPSPT
ncbi:MAG: hypothetical protein PHH93_10375, partial [Prolixibacteraceae bacterium]|nr:hypothetical protein [Prolixibacteraceae bacterium]